MSLPLPRIELIALSQIIFNMLSIKNKKIITIIFSFTLLLPSFVLAQMSASTIPDTGLVPCGNPGQPSCDFTMFVFMVNNIIQWIISIAGVIFTISTIYGGFLYVTSGENPGNKAKAKSILWSTVIGFVIILVSWLIVYTILINLVPNNSSVFQFIGRGN